MPGALASWAHDTSAPGEPWTCSRGSARDSTMPWTPEIRRSRASAVAAGGGTDPTATSFPGLTSLTVENSSRRVLLAAASPFSVKCLVSWVASSAAATVKMNSARTTPLTARNAARGSSASRRAAIRVSGRLARRAITRAPAIVSHGPARIRPIMISAKPGTYTSTLPPGLAGLPCTTTNPSSARPASSGSTRQARSEPRVTRRLTPSGEMFTRRSASRAARADAAGTPTATARMSGRLRDSSAGKNDCPVNGMAASGIRSTKNSPKPMTIPAAAAPADSTAAITEVCLGVAPTSRIAANRCSRRAADRRVAVPMKISTGISSARATTDRTRSMPDGVRPPRITQVL